MAKPVMGPPVPPEWVDQAKVLAAKGLDKSRKFITDTLAPATGDAIVTVAAAADVLVHKAAREIDRLIAEHGPEDVKKLIGDLRGRLSEVTGRRPPPGQVPPTTDKKTKKATAPPEEVPKPSSAVYFKPALSTAAKQPAPGPSASDPAPAGPAPSAAPKATPAPAAAPAAPPALPAPASPPADSHPPARLSAAQSITLLLGAAALTLANDRALLARGKAAELLEQLRSVAEEVAFSHLQIREGTVQAWHGVTTVGLEEESGPWRNVSPWLGYRWTLEFEFEEMDHHRRIARATRELLSPEGQQRLRELGRAAARGARDAAAAALELAAHAEAALLGGAERAVRRAVRRVAQEADALVNPATRREAADRYFRALNVEPSSVRVTCEARMIGVRDEERDEKVGSARGFGCRWRLTWDWLGQGPAARPGSSLSARGDDPAGGVVLTLSGSKRGSPQHSRAGSGAYSPVYPGYGGSGYPPQSPRRTDSGARPFSGGAGAGAALATPPAAAPHPASMGSVGGSFVSVYGGPHSPPRDTIGLANVSAAIDRLAALAKNSGDGRVSPAVSARGTRSPPDTGYPPLAVRPSSRPGSRPGSAAGSIPASPRSDHSPVVSDTGSADFHAPGYAAQPPRPGAASSSGGFVAGPGGIPRRGSGGYAAAAPPPPAPAKSEPTESMSELVEVVKNAPPIQQPTMAWQKPILVDILNSKPATPPPGAAPPPPPVSTEPSEASSVGAEPDTPRIAERHSPAAAAAAAAAPASPVADRVLEPGALAAEARLAAHAAADEDGSAAAAPPAKPELKPLPLQLLRRVNTPVGEVNFLTGAAPGEEPQEPSEAHGEESAAKKEEAAEAEERGRRQKSGGAKPAEAEEYVSWSNDEDLESPAQRHRSPYATPERRRMSGRTSPGLYFKPVVDSPSKDPESFLVSAA